MKTALRLLFVLISIFGYSQEFSMDLVKNMTPRNIGPGGMSGRVTSIDVVLSNPDIMYAGTASGGLWKSTSGGIKWVPIFDDEVTASIGAVAVQQSNPDVIWVGTGEGNPRNSLNGGFGVYKSLDGGKSWYAFHLFSLKTQQVIRRQFPILVIILAGLFILRGLGLDIPYLSPAPIDFVTNEINCH